MRNVYNGMLLLILGIVSIPICGMDATAAVFIIPIAVLSIKGGLREHRRSRRKQSRRNNELIRIERKNAA